MTHPRSPSRSLASAALAAALLLSGGGIARAQNVPRAKSDLVVGRESAYVRRHAVFVDRRGRPLRIAVRGEEPPPPDTGDVAGEVMSLAEYDAYLGAMMTAVRGHPEKPILVFVHGGLTGFDRSMRNDLAWPGPILADGSYPIFINWHSALLATLGEHICCIRQGKRERWAPLTAPLPVAGGLVNAAMEAIPTWYSQAGDGFAPVFDRRPDHEAIYDSLRAQFERPDQLRVSRGEVTGLLPAWARVTAAGLTSPFRIVFSPLVAGYGAPAWENMLRRIKLMFRAEGERETAFADAMNGRPGYRAPSGAVSLLMDSVSALVRSEGNRRPVVLIGHSMGAIVIDEMLQRYPDLPVSVIVYMAPASSVRDLETSVIPYLRKHRDTRFYLLTLHPRADQREKAAGTDFFPAGSLLEWLDDYLTKPHTRMDRRLGKWRNIMEHHYVFPPEVRGRVHVKAFGIGDATVLSYGNKPTRHGQFNDLDVPFWRREFREPVRP